MRRGLSRPAKDRDIGVVIIWACRTGIVLISDIVFHDINGIVDLYNPSHNEVLNFKPGVMPACHS